MFSIHKSKFISAQSTTSKDQNRVRNRRTAYKRSITAPEQRHVQRESTAARMQVPRHRWGLQQQRQEQSLPPQQERAQQWELLAKNSCFSYTNNHSHRSVQGHKLRHQDQCSLKQKFCKIYTYITRFRKLHKYVTMQTKIDWYQGSRFHINSCKQADKVTSPAATSALHV